MKRKHNYPNKRKPRDTSYSMTHRLIERYGEDQLRHIWSKLGMYQAAELFSKELGQWVTPNVVRYLSYKFNWVRQVEDLSLPFVKGVLLGNTDAGYYKHVKIVGLPQTDQHPMGLST
jgi:hypothetical protein